MQRTLEDTTVRTASKPSFEGGFRGMLGLFPSPHPPAALRRRSPFKGGAAQRQPMARLAEALACLRAAKKGGIPRRGLPC